jgi:hypothetical protein
MSWKNPLDSFQNSQTTGGECALVVNGGKGQFSFLIKKMALNPLSLTLKALLLARQYDEDGAGFLLDPSEELSFVPF